MIVAVTGNKPLPARIRQDIVERTDGIPLFIEEMTKAVLEAGGQEGAERAIASIPAPSLTIPASLHASLMARLDRLGSAKEVAQIGAVIGREFSHALLAAVARKGERALQAGLDGLTGAGCCFGGVHPRRRLTCSNTAWCRIRLTAPFYASADERCTPALRKSWKPNSRKPLRAGSS
jgi:hypothetical protein